MKTDSLFYELFQSSPGVLLELIGLPPAQGGNYSFVSQEVKQTRFQIDGILLPHHRRADLPIYFIEVQGYRDRRKGENFYYGFFSEVFLYLNDYRPQNDWKGVVIFTEKRFDPGLTEHFREYAPGARLQRIYLDETPEDWEGHSLEVSAIQLIGVKEAIAPEKGRALVERARVSITDAKALHDVLELISTIFVYKFGNLSREEIESMLGLSELKQTKVYQEAKLEGKLEAVPVLMEAGLTVEQIATRLGLDITAVTEVAQQTSSPIKQKKTSSPRKAGKATKRKSSGTPE
ncbi:Rpn family recombination-promoting nuclease/putative transposase (plasmid) [Kovacikia minuta CCNUW1]|uniref:Rpn family recombination-promoting nuclease/putative transposase n=1 Tax=Kovacikia minuta TaxID=2931930 RepID=UPI001CCA2939|nr:Rpn family recombination-promoting nuclease/putative transposase [Kovacikia minuta]UBF30785.1 Rpn family recombination-promoting nuclease/putative transposase [Kovacikia minuta CCNUW1]